jgi:hypothetical protein
MAMSKQVTANRRNAALSTGPRSANGMNAMRFNAVKHGLRAKSVLLPDEDPSEYHDCAVRAKVPIGE